MRTVKVYTPKELKEKFPDAFKKAHRHYADEQNEIFWVDETLDSFKAIFFAAGVDLTNWSIGAYDRSSCSFDMEEDVYNLSGARAETWLENNLFSGLRVPDGIGHIRERMVYGYKVGTIPSCPFTGYFADDDFIESLVKNIKAGRSLGEAFHDLANTARDILENELDFQQSEEYFLEQELEFTEEGTQI